MYIILDQLFATKLVICLITRHRHFGNGIAITGGGRLVFHVGAARRPGGHRRRQQLEAQGCGVGLAEQFWS